MARPDWSDGIELLLAQGLLAQLRRTPVDEPPGDFFHEFFFDPWSRGLQLEGAVFLELCSALTAIPEVAGIFGATLYPGRAGSGEVVGVESIAWWLLERSLDSEPARAVGEFQQFLATRSGFARWVLLVDGVRVIEPVDLGAGVQLMPFSALPNSLQKRAVERHLRGGVFGQIEPAALTTSTPISQILLPIGYSAPAPSGVLRLDWSDPDYRLEAVCSLLALFGEIAPKDFGAWVQASGTGVPSQGAFALSFLPGPGSFGQITVDPGAARELINRFFDLAETYRNHLMVPLGRLGQSMRQPTVEGAAIDLRTALEAMLVKDGNGEFSHKVALRGAWLLGETVARRRAIFKELKDAYSWGSVAVHKGAIPPAKREAATVAIRNARRLVQEMLRRLIAARQPIDVEALEFGQVPAAPELTS